MKYWRENPLVQFSIVSFAMFLILAVVNAVIFAALAKQAGASPWNLFWSLGISFALLYSSLVALVWRGWTTIDRSRRHLESINADLEKSVEEKSRELKDSVEHVLFEIAEREDLEEQLRVKMEETAIVDEVSRAVASTPNRTCSTES